MTDIKPFDEVDELLAWKRPYEPSGNQILRNYKKDKLAVNEREILLCHDMMGGYLDQERDQGYLVPNDSNPYVFLNWWNIDIFCYFSHHLVTIPPSGCLVMGTFITEFEAGIAKCGKLFESKETMEKAVMNLVDIAEYYCFEGWLINIENKLTLDQLPLAHEFLQLLTTTMRSRLGVSRVIWYDAVTVKGTLDWQNQLNDRNKSFYDCCDGIFLNYVWTDLRLLNSADFGILSRIYVGVDIFGRGCIGQWDSYRSFARVALLRMSLAVFAPGWVTEKHPQEDPIDINLKFWRLVQKSTIIRPILDPFTTNFSAGFTNKDNGKLFRLADVSLQPHYGGDFFKPLPTGGLLIMNAGTYRLFICDFDKKSTNIRIDASADVIIFFNQELVHLKQEGASTRIGEMVLALKTVDICTEDDNTVIKSIQIF